LISFYFENTLLCVFVYFHVHMAPTDGLIDIKNAFNKGFDALAPDKPFRRGKLLQRYEIRNPKVGAVLLNARRLQRYIILLYYWSMITIICYSKLDCPARNITCFDYGFNIAQRGVSCTTQSEVLLHGYFNSYTYYEVCKPVYEYKSWVMSCKFQVEKYVVKYNFVKISQYIRFVLIHFVIQ